MDRYRIEIQHGEHRSLWYIIDTEAPDDEQPAVVRTCFSLGHAEDVAGTLNAAAQRERERREARFVEQQRQFDDLDEIRGGGYR